MNNDYRSALNKIYPAKEKTAEVKQLFKSRSMRRKNLIKPVIAVAACMALAIGVGSFGNAWNIGKSITTVANGFTVQVNAKTLDSTKGVSISNDLGFVGGISEGDKGVVGYDTEFPVTCSGDNIKKITYSIDGGVFQISSKKNDSVVVEGNKVDNMVNTPAAMPKGSNEICQYTSFTVDYDKQTTDSTLISIAYSSDKLSDAQFEKIKKNVHYIGDGNTAKEKEIFDEFYKDLTISCTVTYNDGTTETKDIVVSAKTGRMSEIEKNLPEGKDCDLVLSVYKTK